MHFLEITNIKSREKNGLHFAHCILNAFLWQDTGNFIQISLKFAIGNISPLFQVMTWRRIDDKLLCTTNCGTFAFIITWQFLNPRWLPREGGAPKIFWRGCAAPVFDRIPLAKEILVENIPLVKQNFPIMSSFSHDFKEVQSKYFRKQTLI